MKTTYFLSVFILFEACLLSCTSSELPPLVKENQNIPHKKNELSTDSLRRVIQSSNLKDIMWIKCPDLNVEIRVYQLSKKKADLWDGPSNIAYSGVILQKGDIAVQIQKDCATIKIGQYENQIKKYVVENPMIISQLHRYFITEDGIFYAKTIGIKSHPWERKASL